MSEAFEQRLKTLEERVGSHAVELAELRERVYENEKEAAVDATEGKFFRRNWYIFIAAALSWMGYNVFGPPK